MRSYINRSDEPQAHRSDICLCSYFFLQLVIDLAVNDRIFI
jgi:hypothetical protein